MVENIREHPRLEKQKPPGQRVSLSLGTLFIPPNIQDCAETNKTPLVLAFHCGDWIPEIAVSRLPNPIPCLSVQLGAGSARYSAPFDEDIALLERLISEAARAIKCQISDVTLVSWSAGYGAIGQILSRQHHSIKISGVLLIDGLHASYVDGKPGPEKSSLQIDSLEPFLIFARQAVQEDSRLMILHTQIFPGTYASTTETADWLLQELNLKRHAILRWGPMKTQILGETIAGGLSVRAFAGNSAPDHIDLLHSLPEFLLELLAK